MSGFHDGLVTLRDGQDAGRSPHLIFLENLKLLKKKRGFGKGCASYTLQTAALSLF